MVLVPRLAGIKVSNEDCTNLQHLLKLRAAKPNFAVLTGPEFLVAVHLRMGCDGAIGGLYTICPHLAARLYRAFLAGVYKISARFWENAAGVSA